MMGDGVGQWFCHCEGVVWSIGVRMGHNLVGGFHWKSKWQTKGEWCSKHPLTRIAQRHSILPINILFSLPTIVLIK